MVFSLCFTVKSCIIKKVLKINRNNYYLEKGEHMKKYISLVILTSIVALVLAACNSDEKDSNSTSTETSTNLSIYTTVYPLQYFTERIGGEFVNVQSIYPTGANEHTYEPTQKDMIRLADADLFFYIGLGLEGFVENAKKTLANEHVEMIATADNLTEDQLTISTGHTHAEADEDAHGHEHDSHQTDNPEQDHSDHQHDTHVWLSPVLSKQMALSIKETLAAKLPEHANTFDSNYKKLISDLDALDAEFKKLADETTNDTFFVSHAAFGYIAGHYGFKQVPVAGLNSQSEPSQKELTSIVDLAKEQNIEYIFFEQNVNSKLTEIIQQEVGAKSLILHNLSVLTSEDISNNETYFTLMEKNIEALRKALK